MRKSIAQLFLGNLTSKFVGLAREIMVAAFFGTGQAMAAFRVAQTSTLVPVNFLTNEGLNSAFIPQYKSMRSESIDLAQTFLWVGLLIFGLISVVLTAAMFLFADQGIRYIAPGLAVEDAALTRKLVDVMALGVPFYLISSLLMFLSMAHGDFLPMSVRATVQNVGMMVGALFAYLFNQLEFLAWGFSLSYAVLMVWVVARARKANLLAFPRTWSVGAIRRVTWRFGLALRPLLMLPVFLQGNIVIERAVASLIGIAAISALDYARFITETMILLVSMPVAFAGLAAWSGLGQDEIRRKAAVVMPFLLCISAPVSLFLAMHAELIVQLIYARGKFNAESTVVTAAILTGSAVGLWAQVLGYVLIKALNAQMRNGAVLKLMVVALLCNSLFNVATHAQLGPLTLGLGNSIYGIIVLGGTLFALGLWREFAQNLTALVIGSVGYVCLSIGFSLQFTSVWTEFGFVCFLAISYWLIWFLAIPSLRSVLKATILFLRVSRT